MDKILPQFGFKKDGLYSWTNEPYHISIYFDGLTITKCLDDDETILYEGIVPKNKKDEIELIERWTKLRINSSCLLLVDSTKSVRIFSNTSLYISNMIITYFKYNDINEDGLCKELNISKDRLKKYLTGTYDFTLSELAKLSVLIGKSITIK